MTLYQALLEAENIKVISPARIKRIKDFINMLEEFKKQIDTPVSPQIKNIIEKSGLLEFFQKSEDGESAVENLYELVNSSADYDKQNDNPNLLDFVQQISLFSDADAYDESSERTALMTLHAAKGLEFDYVFIIGLEEGVLPHERSMDEDAQIEEERRLLFVGTTRAREYLNISYAEYRTFRGQFLRTIPSRFLQELGIDIEGNLDNNQSVSRDVNIPSPEESRSGKNKEFEKGELVRHPKFGFGRVVKFSALGANSVIKIKFNSGHTKVLMLKYAKLTKVEN
jgi:DNA helicase-2/ATP-dependent DNA helicase PcrA